MHAQSEDNKMFSEQERQAFDLGRRMAETGFALQDNPFTRIHPRFAVQWSHGFFAANALRGLGAALSRGDLSTPRRQPRLVSAA
jgi:succinate dehydrogenase/fumarate reductase flavoprotein subunit